MHERGARRWHLLAWTGGLTPPTLLVIGLATLVAG